MWPGWVAVGPGDPFTTTDYIELVNNARAFSYVRNAGISWLQDCLDCPGAEKVMPGGPEFISPTIDPAPWYDENNPDTWGFLGVVGLEVVGADTSTRQVTITNTLQEGGIAGPPYFGPRTMVFRGLLVATDQCSLQTGLDWLSETCLQSEDPCHGDALTYFDCCPCVCDDENQIGPCWPSPYEQMTNGPTCARLIPPPGLAPPGTPPTRGPVWWPITYAELTSGPPPDDEDWCAWVRSYYDLENGPPGWACCVDECVVPYLRQYHRVRVTSGPTILRQPVMNTCGALMEFEMTIVAADPRKYTMPSVMMREIAEPGEPLVEMELVAAKAVTVDPFAIPGVTTARYAVATRTVERPAVSESWLRTIHRSTPPTNGTILYNAVPIIHVAAIDGDVGEVRLGLWRSGYRVAGFWLPFIPGGSTVTLDGGLRRVIANVNGSDRTLSGFVRGYDGERVTWGGLGHGPFELTVDQHPERAGRLVVEVHAVDVGLS